MYQTVRLLGWGIVVLYLLSVDRYFLRLSPFSKMQSLKPVKKFLVKHHKKLGIATIVIALVHANLAFANISPSLTGSAAFLTMIIGVLLGVLMHYKKIEMKNVRVHRMLSIALIVLIAAHILFPYIFVF